MGKNLDMGAFKSQYSHNIRPHARAGEEATRTLSCSETECLIWESWGIRGIQSPNKMLMLSERCWLYAEQEALPPPYSCLPPFATSLSEVAPCSPMRWGWPTPLIGLVGILNGLGRMAVGVAVAPCIRKITTPSPSPFRPFPFSSLLGTSVISSQPLLDNHRTF